MVPLIVVFLRKLKRYSTFLLTGLVAFCVNLLLTWFFTGVIGLWYLASAVIGVVASWTVAFFLNSLITFRGHDHTRYITRYIKNLFIYLALAPIGLSLVYVATSIVGFHYLLSLTLVVGCMSILSFVLFKHYVFEYKEER